MRVYLIISGICLILISSAIWLYHCQQIRTSTIQSKILKPDVAEKLIVDPSHHSLIIISERGTEALSLPDRASAIEVLKTGKLRLNVPQYGYEVSPFIGIGYSAQLNDYIGLDLFYWKRLDIGTSFSFDRDLKIKTLGFPILLSYTVWRNTRISIGLEPFGEHSVHGLVSVRL